MITSGGVEDSFGVGLSKELLPPEISRTRRIALASSTQVGIAFQH
jgi:hypothetical protein